MGKSDNTVCAGFLLPHPPVLIPEVGQGRELDAAKTLGACRKVASRIATIKPDTVVVISPHAPLFGDYLFVYDSAALSGSFARFGAHSVSLSCAEDVDFVKIFKSLLGEAGIPGGTPDASVLSRYDIDEGLDHGVLVPLSFILAEWSDFSLVSLSSSAFELPRVLEIGRLLAVAATKAGRRACVVASGDMSHKVNRESPYGMVEDGARFDAAVDAAIESGRPADVFSIDPALRERAAECGYNSLVMALGALGYRDGPDPSEAADVTRGSSPRSTLYSSEAPFGIGYCVAEFLPGGSHD